MLQARKLVLIGIAEANMITKRLLLTTVAAVSLGLVAAATVSAQSYPQRPIKIVVSLLPGTGPDLIARAVADKLSARFGQTIVVENRPGAGGNIGAEAVVKSPADGHTLLVSLNTTFTVNPSLYKKPSFDPSNSFRYISTLTKTTNMLVVHSSIPVSSVADFVAYAKKEPISYAHGGPGTPGHLAMEYFRLLAGFQTVPVPYRGNTQLATDLAAGQIKFGFVGMTGVAPHIRAGRLKGLAISAGKRWPLAPEVPTIAESGYPEFEYESYYVLAAPAGIPDPIAMLLEHEVKEALASSELQEKLRAQDTLIDWAGGADTKARIKADAQLWAKVVKATGMRVN
jgi:tripartite-type tricarboxylate transporter receptor subunit TctC